MRPRERQAVIAALVHKSGAALESFFRSHDLADAYRKPDEGWGKEKRVNEALEAATTRGDLDDVLRDAVRHFALAEDRRRDPRQVKLRSPEEPAFAVARMAQLHPLIQNSSQDLLRDGHAAAAILEAFKAVELRVRRISGLSRRGRDLMAHAFGDEPPHVPLNPGTSESDRNEQEGFKHVFMGVAQGIRNPKAHDPFAPLDEERAFEYLAVASLLMRRLDDAEALKELRAPQGLKQITDI
jgi:uncharacterized protein (TIGR02391 family)